MDFGLIASVAGPLISGMMQSDSAEQAGQAQQQATDAAIGENRRQFDLSRGDVLSQYQQSRTDLAPYRNVGGAAISRLGTMLGLSPNGSQAWGGSTSMNRAPAKTLDQIAQELRSSGRFSSGGDPNSYDAFYDRFIKQGLPPEAAHVSAYSLAQERANNVYQPYIGPARGFDEQALSAEAQRLFDAQGAQGGTVGQFTGGELPSNENDPNFGSLNKKFTLADFWDDPVTKASYQFGLDTGTKALGNMAGARGNRNSGAQLKALTRFASDYTGGQAAGSSSRFYGDQDRDFNRLAAVTGVGQTATNTGANLGANAVGTVANLGANNANTVGNLLSAQGNARGAAAIAGGNAMAGGINTVGNWWNQQQTLDKILGSRSNPYTMSNTTW